jgi:hypothetical protein
VGGISEEGLIVDNLEKENADPLVNPYFPNRNR